MTTTDKIAPIETTTFDVALRHMKNGGFALARFGSTSEAVSLCYFDGARNAIQRLAFWKSTRYAEEIYAPFVHVVGADWVLLRRDAFVRNPEEAAADGAVRAFTAESAEAIETALAEELDAILGTKPPTDAARPTKPEPTNGDDVAGSAGYVC